MSGRPTRLAAALLLSLGLTVGACGGGPASTVTGPTRTVTVTATPGATGSATPKAPAPTAAGDKLACDDMETVMEKMSRAALGWVPGTHPFDKTVGTKIRLLTVDMAADERKATTPTVREGVHQSTVAFTSLARAMAGNSKTKVMRTIGQTQLAYSRLKQVCGL